MAALIDLWSFIWSWYNLPFTLSILVCLLLSALQFTGWLGDELELDSDLDADADLDAELEVEADSDFDSDGSAPTSVLDFMGIGRVPLTLWLMVFTAAFGITGWMINRLWLQVTQNDLWGYMIVLWGVTSFISLFITSRFAGVLARILPSLTTTATSKEQLVGRVARVISPKVDGTYGQVRVQDAAGTRMTLFAITSKNSPPISRDTEVVLVDFDPERRIYTVMPLDHGLSI